MDDRLQVERVNPGHRLRHRLSLLIIAHETGTLIPFVRIDLLLLGTVRQLEVKLRWGTLNKFGKGLDFTPIIHVLVGVGFGLLGCRRLLF
jgi:hypothetical protein